MTVHSRAPVAIAVPSPATAARQACWLLRGAFTVLPIVFGLLLGSLALVRLAAPGHGTDRP